jgi:IS5 family transposase
LQTENEKKAIKLKKEKQIKFELDKLFKPYMLSKVRMEVECNEKEVTPVVQKKKGKSYLSKSLQRETKNNLNTKWEKNEIHLSSKEVVTNKLAKTNVYFQTNGRC